jgi:hypothetical protein
MKRARLWLAALALVGLAWMVMETNSSRAGEDKAVKAAVLKIAKALEKGDSTAAATEAKALAKSLEDLEAIMHLFKPRTKKGLGVGGKAGAITPDGIELCVIALGRDGPRAATFKRDADAYADMGYTIAAIAEVIQYKPPEKDAGKKTKREWMSLSKDMKEGGMRLAESARKGVAEVKAAANKLNNSCNSCHTIFKP